MTGRDPSRLTADDHLTTLHRSILTSYDLVVASTAFSADFTEAADKNMVLVGIRYTLSHLWTSSIAPFAEEETQILTENGYVTLLVLGRTLVALRTSMGPIR